MNVVITGTSRGIGSELVKLFLDAKYQVTGVSRSEVFQDAVMYRHIQCDLESSTEVQKMVKEIKGTLDRIDILIHNAADFVKHPFEELTDLMWKKMFEVNLFAPVEITKGLLTLMGGLTPSHIVFISSMAGFQGSEKFPGLSAYAASKGAVTSLTECLATEFKEKNIYVNSLALGAVHTQMLGGAFPGLQEAMGVREVAEGIFQFSLRGYKTFNGKVLPMALGTP